MQTNKIFPVTFKGEIIHFYSGGARFGWIKEQYQFQHDFFSRISNRLNTPDDLTEFSETTLHQWVDFFTDLESGEETTNLIELPSRTILKDSPISEQIDHAMRVNDFDLSRALIEGSIRANVRFTPDNRDAHSKYLHDVRSASGDNSILNTGLIGSTEGTQSHFDLESSDDADRYLRLRTREALEEFRSEASGRSNEIFLEIQQQVNQKISQLLKTGEERNVDATKAARETFTEQQSAMQTSFDAMLASIREKVGMDETTKLWGELEAKHRGYAQRFGLSFGACLLGAIIAIYWLKGSISGILKNPQVPENMDGATAAAYLFLQQASVATLIGTPILLTIWFLRVLLRQALLNNRLMHDADMRKRMAESYIHLRSENAIPEEAIVPAVEALFRPVTPHPTDDGLPTNPFQIIRPGKDKSGK